MLKAIYRRRAILLSYLWLYIYWLTAKAEDNKVPIEKTTQHVCGVCRPVDYGYSVYFHLLLLFLSSSLLPARLRLFCADSGEGPRQSDIDWEPFSPSRVFLSTAHTHTHTEINRPCHPPLFLVDDGRINTRDGFAALDDPFKYFFFPLLSCDGRRRQSIPMTARKLWFIFRLTWFRSFFFLYFPIPAYLGSTFAPHRLLLFVAATRRAQLSDVIRYNQVKIKMAVADQLGMYEVVKKKSSPPQLWPRHFLFQFNLANKSFPVNVNNQARETLWLF